MYLLLDLAGPGPIRRLWARPLPAPSITIAPSPIGEQGLTFYADSGDATLGVVYKYQLASCDGQYLVDFDGSMWELDSKETRAARDPIGRFDFGTITLATENRAEYRSSNGHRLIFSRGGDSLEWWYCD
jgi:hypothetical protein